jgi:hypothetical protein
MLGSSFQNLVAVNRLPDPLVVQLRRFTSSLREQGYSDEAVRVKVKRITNFVQWLKRNRVVVADLDERLVEAFLKRRPREREGGLRAFQQFLDHLRRQNTQQIYSKGQPRTHRTWSVSRAVLLCAFVLAGYCSSRRTKLGLKEL